MTAHRTRTGGVVVTDVMSQRMTFFAADNDSAPKVTPSPVPLPMGVPEASLPFAVSFSAANATLASDTIWAVWALSDTLYKFDSAGERLAAVPLSLARPMGEMPASDAVLTDPREIQHAFDALTQLYKAFVLDSGEKVVVSMQTREFGSVWDILILGSEAATVWKAANMPRLHTVDQGVFYFRDPESVLPNHWLIGTAQDRCLRGP